MGINYNKSILSLYKNEPTIRPFFSDCFEINTTKSKVYMYIFNLLSRGYYDSITDIKYAEMKPLLKKISNQEFANSIDYLIKLTGIDVNFKCYPEYDEDFMFNAMQYGSKEDVEMLLKNGYSGTETIYGSIIDVFSTRTNIRDYEEKIKILKKYGIGDYSHLGIHNGIDNAEIEYNHCITEGLNNSKIEYTAEEKAGLIEKNTKYFDDHFKEIKSLLREMSYRKIINEKRFDSINNQIIRVEYTESAQNSNLFKEIVKPLLSLDRDKATTKLLNRLIELKIPLDDIQKLFIECHIPLGEDGEISPLFEKFYEQENLKYSSKCDIDNSEQTKI